MKGKLDKGFVDWYSVLIVLGFSLKTSSKSKKDKQIIL